MKPIDINLEEAAAEDAQDRKDLATLRAKLNELLKHEEAVSVPVMVRRLVDAGVDPVVIAKTLLVGDRDGGVLYRLSARTPALGHHEEVCVELLWIATRELQEVTAATMMVAGAVWLAEQFGISRELLTSFLAEQPVRAFKFRHERRGWGALDLCDHDGAGSRAWLADIIEKAKLPAFAPLELKVKP